MSPNPQDAPSEKAIRDQARALWEAAGSPEGKDLVFWLKAENKLRDELAAGYDRELAALKLGKPIETPASSPRPPKGSPEAA